MLKKLGTRQDLVIYLFTSVALVVLVSKCTNTTNVILLLLSHTTFFLLAPYGILTNINVDTNSSMPYVYVISLMIVRNLIYKILPHTRPQTHHYSTHHGTLDFN